MSETVEDNASNSIPKHLNFEILTMVKTNQQGHGLRHTDYLKYRQYCSKRIQRIRASLHFNNKHKKRDFQFKEVKEEHLKDVRYLHLVAMLCERAWSYAMQLKQDSSDGDYGKGRKLHHAVERLRKAVKLATELDLLCQSERVDARTKLESGAYLSWMKATLFLEQDQWKLALSEFRISKTIYENLSKISFNDVYKQKCKEIDSSIRVGSKLETSGNDASLLSELVKMKYSGGDQILSGKLNSLISQASEKQAKVISDTTWRGQQICVTNEQVRVLLVNIEAYKHQLEDTDVLDNKVSIYDSLISDIKDGLSTLKDEAKNSRLSAYLQFVKLVTMIGRNQTLADHLHSMLILKTTTKRVPRPQELLRLHDFIIQSLTEIPPLLPNDKSLEQEADLFIVYHKAFRCFYLGLSNKQAKKYKESYALLDRAINYAVDSLSSFERLKMPVQWLEADPDKLRRLQLLARSSKYESLSSIILDDTDVPVSAAKSSPNDKRTLDERLDCYNEMPSNHIVTFPPNYQPTPCKPLFFDVSLNHVTFPASLHEAVQASVGSTGQQQGGIMGRAMGWLWGGAGKK